MSLVSHFQIGSWQVLYRPGETGNIERWGIPLMIPNFSRLKNGIYKEKGTTLPIHGFGRSFPWTVIEQGPNLMSMQLTSNSATRLHYPYDFTFCIAIDGHTIVGSVTEKGKTNARTCLVETPSLV